MQEERIPCALRSRPRHGGLQECVPVLKLILQRDGCHLGRAGAPGGIITWHFTLTGKKNILIAEMHPPSPNGQLEIVSQCANNAGLLSALICTHPGLRFLDC